MGQVSVTLNGRTYRLRCGDGEEERLLTVVSHVRGHVDRLVAEHGQIGDDRLVLMAAIMITDELFEVREQQRLGAAVSPRPQAGESTPSVRVPLPQAAADLAASVAATSAAPKPAPVHRESTPVAPPAAHLGGPARVRPPLPAPPPAPPAHVQPPPPVAGSPMEATAGPGGALPRPLEHLDATALMKGIERKSGRN